MLKPINRKHKKLGRPRIFNTPDQMQKKIDAYFAECDSSQTPYTIADLCLFLGFAETQQLWGYQDRYEDFADTVKKARLRVEGQRERALMAPPKGSFPAGVIFALKNCHGWRDKSEVEQHVKSDVPFVVVYPEAKSDDRAKKPDGAASTPTA